MKKLIVAMTCLSGLGLAGTALAVPPAKSTILHCGCVVDNPDVLGVGTPNMKYSEISVSSKSRGHDSHIVGTIDSCSDGGVNSTDFVRTGSDCQVSGPPLGDPIDVCVDQVVEQICGAISLDN